MRTGKRFNKFTGLLLIIILVQVLWLLGIGLTGASTDWIKLIFLGLYTLICGFLVLRSERIENIIAQGTLERILRNEKFILIGVLTAVFIIGTVYAYVQRVWPWDEEYSLYAAKMIAGDGLDKFLLLYKDIYWVHNHPPLIILLNGFALNIFGQKLIVMRMISLLFTIGTVGITYLLAREIADRKTALFASILLPTYPLIFRLGTAGLLDIQVTFFFITAIYLFVRLFVTQYLRYAILLTIVVLAGLLSKYTMFFIIPVMGLLYLFGWRKKKQTVYLILAGSIVGAVFIAWIFIGGSIGLTVPGISLLQHVNADGIAYAQQDSQVDVEPPPGKVNSINVGWYLTSSEGILLLTNNIGTKLTAAVGPYNIPVILLGLFFLIRRRKSYDIFLLIWVVAIGGMLILTLPDHRYFMPMFPALAIIMAIWLESHPEVVNRVLLLSILYLGGSLYLFADWFRAAELFQ